MKPLLLPLLPTAVLALVTTTTWTTSRIVSLISPQYHFHPIYASVVTANATATVYALDCEDQFNTEFEPDNPLAGCAGFTSHLVVVNVPTPSVTSVTFTATSTGKFGTRTISNDCTIDAVSMVCTSRLAGDTVPKESQGDRVDTLPVESRSHWASGEKFTITAGLEYLPAETTEASTTTTSGTGAATTGSGGGVGPKETGTSGAMGRWEVGMGAVGAGAMGVVVGLV